MREPVTATRIGAKTVRGFSPSSSQSSFSDVSIASAVHGSSSASGRDGRGQDRLVQLRPDRARRHRRGTPRTPGTRRAARSSPGRAAPPACTRSAGQSSPCSPTKSDQPVGVLARVESSQVDAVQPVELRVVERPGARADRLEREALHDLVARHHRRLTVGCPADQRQEVDERLGEVAGGAELVHAETAP